MFEAKVYRIAVTTLGAILQEEHQAREAIQRYNTQRAQASGKVLLPLAPGDAAAPDLWVVVIQSYLDPARVEPILQSQRPVAFLFSQWHDPLSSIQAEVDATVAFRARVQGSYPCVDYRTPREFEEALWEVFERI